MKTGEITCKDKQNVCLRTLRTLEKVKNSKIE